MPPGPFTAISVVGQQACAWTAAEEQVCWGEQGEGQWSRYSARAYTAAIPCSVTDNGEASCLFDRLPEDLPPGRYTAVSQFAYPERNDGCALTDSGTVACWGIFAALEDPPLARYTAISVGLITLPAGGWPQWGVCGLTDTGDLLCWGARYVDVGRSVEQYTDRYPGPYVAVEANGDHSFCAVTADGVITNGHWWGDCGFGAAGESPRYTAISFGRNHDCALTAAGTAVCVTNPVGFWGGGAVTTMTPPDPAPGRYTAISVGDGYACALTETGEAVCWGEEVATVAPPEPAPGRYVALSVGWKHGCALTEAGEAVCWGWNNFGQAALPPGSYTAISVGPTDTCAVTATGEAVCWGRGVERLPPGPYRDISVGSYLEEGPSEVCALTVAGEAVCRGWGLEETPPGPFVAISVGWRNYYFGHGHACALTAAGEAVCWGENQEGQTEVPPGRYTAISAATNLTCALTEAGEAVCWGKMQAGRLGIDGGRQDPSRPGRARRTAISAGRGTACAITAAGVVECWSDPRPWTDPERIHRPDLPAGRYTAISLNKSRQMPQDCAVTAAGALVCWGYASYGDPPGLGFP